MSSKCRLGASFIVTSLTAWPEMSLAGVLYESNSPETAEVPDYATAINGDAQLGAWYRLLIVRTLRVDRSMLAIKDFIKATPQIGPRYVEPVTDTLESIYDEMVNHIPTIFLLSAEQIRQTLYCSYVVSASAQ